MGAAVASRGEAGSVARKDEGATNVAHFLLDPLPWAKQQFAECELGDLRRNKRLIRMAEKLAGWPGQLDWPGRVATRCFIMRVRFW